VCAIVVKFPDYSTFVHFDKFDVRLVIFAKVVKFLAILRGVLAPSSHRSIPLIGKASQENDPSIAPVATKDSTN